MIQTWDDLLFAVRLSVRYHSKRAAYYGFLTKLVTAISMILGSGTIASVVKSKEILSMVFGGTISVASIISLVFGFSSKEILHLELMRKFSDLEKSMIAEKTPSEELLRQKTAERLAIEAGEPKTVTTLALLCHNEVLWAQGYGHPVKINCLRSLFKHIDLPFLKIEYEERNISEIFEKQRKAENTEAKPQGVAVAPA